MKTTPSIFLGALFSFTALQSYGETTEEFLRSFHAHPAMMMQRLPSEVLNDGSTKERGFINEMTVAKAHAKHDRSRQEVLRRRFMPPKLMSDPPTTFAISMSPRSLAAKLVEPGELISRIPDMESRKLMTMQISDVPWADSYWPLYKGMIGARYADTAFPDSKDWSTNHDYILSHQALEIWDGGDTQAINQLSPAEKYDLTLGDRNLTLTQYAWAQGSKQMGSFGFVATWMGICHGWAAASHMKATFPDHPVAITAVGGQQVTFYTEDVKALQSMLWANAPVPTRFVGTRCDLAKPERNANGRILDQKCFDIDPATWHLVVTNQLGAHQRSFVMDSTYDVEVWNYPLAAYKITYFNPETWQESRRIKAAMIPLNQFKLDKFPEFRSTDAAYVAGVVMDITHIEAITPTIRNPTTSPTKTLRFIYDLELDKNLDVIGGEWYTNAHPDFIWTFAADAQAYATGESLIMKDAWTREQAIPAAWTSIAKKGSSLGEPLFSFVGKLAIEPLASPPREQPAFSAPPTP